MGRLALEQVTRLLVVLDQLLTQSAGQGDSLQCGEEELLEWIGLLISNHFMQLLVTRADSTVELRTKLCQTVAQLQTRMRLMTESKTILQNLLNTKMPPIQRSSQAYSIEIIQI